jgi:filamentous hemagglutinin
LISASVAGGNAATGSLIGGAGEKYNQQEHEKNVVEEMDYELRKEEGLPIPEQEAEDLGKPEVLSVVPGLPMDGIGPAGSGVKSGMPDGSFTPNPGITVPYARPSKAGPHDAQRAFVQGRPCVDCGVVTSNQVADHIDPLVVQYYRDGAVDTHAQSITRCSSAPLSKLFCKPRRAVRCIWQSSEKFF